MVPTVDKIPLQFRYRFFDNHINCAGACIGTVFPAAPMLTRTAHRTLTEQLADRFAERIRSRLLPAGARLPSVRDCARQQGVSPYTVVAAYDQLLAQGLVEARRQRGFYVRDLAQNMPLAPDSKAQTAIENVANKEQLLREATGGLPSGAHINATALIRGSRSRVRGCFPGSGWRRPVSCWPRCAR